MTGKERVRLALQRQKTDRVPAAFEAVGSVNEKLLRHYGYTSTDQLYDRYQIDIVPVSPRYIGPEMPCYVDNRGVKMRKTCWGTVYQEVTTSVDTYWDECVYPLNGVDTAEKLNEYRFPSPDWFDYSSIREAHLAHPDRAIIIGHEGPFQHMCALMKMDELMILMMEEPELAKEMYDRMVAFELEYYRRCFEAGEGCIDILRTHDDYGTQISLLFSMDMWKDFFMENTRKLTNLAHRYGAFFQQHSCGAVEPIIPYLIECGVDSLEPIQKVKGMDADELMAKYGNRLTFHGGVDTQTILPRGTVQEVKAETRRLIETFGKNGGYILMASQGFEGDVPIENIEALYSVDRRI